MGQRVGIVDLGRYPVMVLPVVMAEHIFIPLVSGSKDHQLDVFRTDLVHHALDQIQSLLVRQTGHDSDHKLFLIPG